MKGTVRAAGVLAALALAACDNPKARVVPPDPMAAGPGQVEAPPAPAEGLSAGLARRSEIPGFTLDHIGTAIDPLNRQPALVGSGAPVVFDGFGFDPVAKAPAKGIDVVVDGKPHGAAYGRARQDVADYFKTPSLAPVGFTATVPAGALAAGPHVVAVRVVAVDGKSYFESPTIRFEVR